MNARADQIVRDCRLTTNPVSTNANLLNTSMINLVRKFIPYSKKIRPNKFHELSRKKIGSIDYWQNKRVKNKKLSEEKINSIFEHLSRQK